MSGRSFAPRRHSAAGIFVFLLLALFAVLGTVMVLFGVRLYRVTAEAGDRHSVRRVMNGYLTNTLQCADSEGGIVIRQMGGRDVIVLPVPQDGCETRIYCHEGTLCEQLTDIGAPFTPERGEAICAGEALQAERTGRLLTLTLTGADGLCETVRLSLFCGETEVRP